MAEVKVPSLAEIADDEADKALRELYEDEWQKLRLRIYASMKSAIRWHERRVGKSDEHN